MIYFRTREPSKRRLSQSSQDEDLSPVHKLFEYHYTMEIDDENSKQMIVARQCDLDSQGISQLVINLVRNSLKKESNQLTLFSAALNLGIALLNGGNREVQVRTNKQINKQTNKLTNCVYRNLSPPSSQHSQ